MKNNKLLLIIVLLLGGVAVFFYMRNNQSTISESLRDFATKDTASIVKIFLAHKSGQETLLEKQPSGEWLINSTDPARPDAIKGLLTTIHDVEVRSPVAKAAYNNVIKSMAANGIKVELYNKSGLIKTYYVGGPTADQLGTFMYLENSTVPFITHIPGFDGYLTPRYIINRDEWHTKSVFKISTKNFKQLSVTEAGRPERTFTITQNQEGKISLLNAEGKELEGASHDKIVNYLEAYQELTYEMKEKSLSASQMDSIKAEPPFRSISFTDSGNNTQKVDFWRRPITTATINKATQDGEPFPFDVDRMIARINNDSQLIVVQYFSFEKLFRKQADFLMQPAQK